MTRWILAALCGLALAACSALPALPQPPQKPLPYKLQVTFEPMPDMTALPNATAGAPYPTAEVVK